VGGDGSGSGADADDVPVFAGNPRWERPAARSFWNALSDPEREALAAAGSEELFRAGSVLCREGEDSSQVMIIDAGWVKVSVRAGGAGGEHILAVRGQGDVVGERAALTTQVRSASSPGSPPGRDGGMRLRSCTGRSSPIASAYSARPIQTPRPPATTSPGSPRSSERRG
jgi:hypothetical protein